MKHVAFIDCFIKAPSNKCVNSFAINSQNICSYHMPSQFGLDSLNSLEKVDSYIILGSTSHVTEKLLWHRDLLDFIIPKIEDNIPVLGICFGHQLIADYYGCKVDYMFEDKRCLKQAREIKIKESFTNYKEGDSLELIYEHSQAVVDLSPRFKCLASSSVCKNEIIQHTEYPFIGLQAHPEASEKFITENVSDSSQHKISELLKTGHSFIDSCIHHSF